MTAVEFLIDNFHYYYSTKWNDILEKAKEMEKQKQDEFAIGFAEWKNKGCYCNDILTKELLEIYKKENKL
jgi:CO dehydrogenase nickel-insertion accessory protein CooC1